MTLKYAAGWFCIILVIISCIRHEFLEAQVWLTHALIWWMWDDLPRKEP